jgi:hypothetical protein
MRLLVDRWISYQRIFDDVKGITNVAGAGAITYRIAVPPRAGPGFFANRR